MFDLYNIAFKPGTTYCVVSSQLGRVYIRSLDYDLPIVTGVIYIYEVTCAAFDWIFTIVYNIILLYFSLALFRRDGKNLSFSKMGYKVLG
jgi:hypothetical protein